MQRSLALLTQIINKSWFFFFPPKAFARCQRAADGSPPCGRGTLQPGRAAGARRSGYQPFWPARLCSTVTAKEKPVFLPTCLTELKSHSEILSVRSATESYGFYVKLLVPETHKVSLLLPEFRQLQETQMLNTRSGQRTAGVSASFTPLLYCCMQYSASKGIYNKKDMCTLKKKNTVFWMQVLWR